MANPGVRLPGFLHEGKVRFNMEGAKTVGSLIGGVTLAAGIMGAGVWLFNELRDQAGIDETSGVSVSVN
jgi:hypothetical protein